MVKNYEKGSDHNIENYPVQSFSKDVRTDMIYLSGGKFLMGTDDSEGFPADGEGPVRKIILSPFYIDPYAVSNADFKAFVSETGYVTDAEKYGWSFVFHLLVSEESKKNVDQVVQG